MEEKIYELLKENPFIVWIFSLIILVITIKYAWRVTKGLWRLVFKKPTNQETRKRFYWSRGHIILGSVVLEIIIGAAMVIPTFLSLEKTEISIELIILAAIFVVAIFLVATTPSNLRRLLIFIGFIALVFAFYFLMPESFFQARKQVLLISLFVIELSISLLLAFLMVYFWWAPNNIFFTFVPEGRAKVVIRSDQFKKIIINWKDHILVTPSNKDSFSDNDPWDIVEKEPKKRWFGGLYFYGLFPLDDIYFYNFSWTNMKQNGDVEYHEPEVLDYILLKQDVYLGEIERAEDKAMLPTNIKFVVTMRVINPFKALFNVQNWLETIMNRIRAAVRNAFTENTYDKWISEDKDLADVIKEKLKSFLVEECRGNYGIEVRAIEITDINPGEQYRESTLKEFLGKTEARRIAAELSHTVINMMAEINGFSYGEMKDKILSDTSSSLKKDYEKYCLDLFEKKIAAESGSWVKIDASSGDGLKNDLMELFAGILRMPKGKNKNIKDKKPVKQNQKQEIEESD